MRRLLPFAAVWLFATAPAFAHTGVGDTAGFAHGFAHPIGGMDHVLAMFSVGMLAALLGGRALYLVPLAFVLSMVAGGALGAASIGVPLVEFGIGVSIIALGLAVALRVSMPTSLAMALVGFFAIFHGYAHGAEMPESVSGLAYAAGFVLATALLHACGIGFALLANGYNTRVGQAAGAAVALAGVVIVSSAI
jgi:urease accessory protein